MTFRDPKDLHNLPALGDGDEPDLCYVQSDHPTFGAKMPTKFDPNKIILNINMKKTLNFFQRFKALLLVCLLAGPGLALKSTAQLAQVNENWNGEGAIFQVGANYYGYWNDPNNWTGGYAPFSLGTNSADAGDYDGAVIGMASPYVITLVTNDTQVGQLQLGNGSPTDYGVLLITNGASFEAGDEPLNGGNWTGVGFTGGNGTLIVGPGSSFTCTSHLWVGTTGTEGVVIDNGGNVSIPSGQLGAGWNGGTNYVYVTNNGTMELGQFSPQMLGYPVTTNTKIGYFDIESGGSVIVSNNNLTTYNFSFNANETNSDPALAGKSVNILTFWETNGQLLAYEGQGTIQAIYNPAGNFTTITAIAPVSSQTPIFSVNPSNTIASFNGSATLTAEVNNVPVSYQWEFNGNPLTDGNGISGSKTGTLTIANVTTATTGNYSVVATNTSATSFFASSTSAALNAQSFNLYPVISIYGVNGDSYEVQYTTSLASPVTWTTLGTYTVGTGVYQVVDTATPLSISRFYQVVQVQ